MLEFYTKKHTKWPFNDSKLLWELWNIRMLITSPATIATSYDKNLSSNKAPTTNNPFSGDYHNTPCQYGTAIESAIKLEDLLSHKLLDIVKIVNDDRCSLPQMPTLPNLDTVFDTSFSDLQPYLFNLSYKTSETAPGSHSIIGGNTTKHSEGGPLAGTTAQSSLKKFLLGTLEL